MLRMDQVHGIRHAVLVEGRSQRAVAREQGVRRNTVRKYLGESETKQRLTAARLPARNRGPPFPRLLRSESRWVSPGCTWRPPWSAI